MRIGRGRHPRRRDPRRRFRNHLLLGMVTVALLPLLAFAVLAVFELDTVAKSTANATETAILGHQQSLANAALARRAGVLDDSMNAIDGAVQEGLGGALTKAIQATPAKTRLPATPMTPLGAAFQFVSSSTGALSSTLIVPTGVTTEGRFAAASADPAIEVLLNVLRTELFDNDFLAWRQIRSRASRRFEYALALLNSVQDGPWQRVSKMESDEVKAAIFFPMWKAAAAADSYLAETGMRTALNGAFEPVGLR